MKKASSNKTSSRIAIFATALALFLLLFAAPLYATTYFYVDPDWSGSTTGNASSPWTGLWSSEWSVINNALASDNVTVFFSAREADRDADEASSRQIEIQRKDMSSHRLVLDGMSKYNTNDYSPAWANNSGSSKFHITASGANMVSYSSDELKDNYVTIKGFKLTNTGGGKCLVYWAGDNVIIEDNECTHAAGASDGPGFLFQTILNDNRYNCPGERNASNSCYTSSNVTIQNNKIHDTYGEGIYVGGCYDQTVPICQTGNTGLVVKGNTVIDAGTRGGEGDAIEIKPSWKNVTISGNTIYRTNPTDAAVDGIIVNGSAKIEKNFIHSIGRNGITLNEYSDANVGFRNGAEIKNNIIVNVGVRNGGWAHGILVDYSSGGDDWNNVKIYNNTIYWARANGIRINSPAGSNHEVVNNAVINAGGIEFAAGSASVSRHDNNNYYDSNGGTVLSYSGNSYSGDRITAIEPNSISAPPRFVKTSAPYVDTNFKLQSTSPNIDAGVSLGSLLSDDYFGMTRVVWDIGAAEHSTTTTDKTRPSAPLFLRIVN